MPRERIHQLKGDPGHGGFSPPCPDPFTVVKSENLGRALQRDPDPPCQRNTDKGPEQRGSRVQTAEPDTERTPWRRGRTLPRPPLRPGASFCPHLPLPT